MRGYKKEGFPVVFFFFLWKIHKIRAKFPWKEDNPQGPFIKHITNFRHNSYLIPPPMWLYITLICSPRSFTLLFGLQWGHLEQRHNIFFKQNDAIKHINFWYPTDIPDIMVSLISIQCTKFRPVLPLGYFFHLAKLWSARFSKKSLF